MATNDDLDDFFKKKDRKGHKHKKQAALLTNNEELLKQLVIVTSATTAFKENLDLEENDDDELQANNEAAAHEEPSKQPGHHHKSKAAENHAGKASNGQQAAGPLENAAAPQQDEWEEFVDSNSKYEQLRLKLARNDDDDEEEFYDENDDREGNPNANSENNLDRDSAKDKPVWKISDIKPSAERNGPPTVSEDKAEEQPLAKPAATSTGAYRPPQMRSGTSSSSVTVVSGVHQRTNKKKEPNLASTDEFPTLGATANKK